MNILLEVALTHAHKWRYKFNPQKCVYMMFGQDKEPEVAVVFGTSTVKQVENTLYLGVPLSKDGSNEKEIIDKRAATVTQTLNTFLSLGGSKTRIIPSLSSKF